MSYVTSHLIVEPNNDTWTECPCCGEYIFVDDEELNQNYDYETVSLYCPECTTIFYLEKEED